MKNKLTKTNMLFSNKDLVKLIIPLIIEQLLLMSVGMADTVMVTSAGEAAVSGVSLVDNINILILQIFAAIATGGAVVVAQYLGRKEEDRAKSTAKQLFYIVLIASLTVMALALIFRQHILSLIFGKIENDVMQSALVYFLSTALAYPFIAVYNSVSALFRAVGNSKISMINSLIVNAVNIGVNALLIFKYNMGSLGAGIGTLVSRIVAAVFIMIMWQKKSNNLRMTKIFNLHFNGRIVKQILSVGIPNGLENGMFQIGRLLVLSLIASFGTNAVAANAIGSSVEGVINVPGQAIGLAVITVVGRCVGAGETEQAVAYTKKLMISTYTLMGLMCVALYFSAPGLVTIFNLSQKSAELAVELFKWSAIFTGLFWPLSFTLPNALRASGDVVFPMVVSLASMFICRIALSYVLSEPWGLNMALLGVWFAMFADWIVRDIFFTGRFISGKWKVKNVIK